VCPRVVLALALLALPFGAAAQTAYVDDDNCPGPGTGTSLDPYCKIQDAICNLDNSGGGTVEVRAGHYNESLRMFPGVSVVSADGPAVTTIDASGKPCITASCMINGATTSCSTVVWGSGSTPSDRLEGFTITGGAGLFRQVGGADFIAGGGLFVFNSSPTITNNHIVDNVISGAQAADFRGAGVYVEGAGTSSLADPVITSNLIARNVADPPPGTGGGYLQSYARGGAFYLGNFARGTIEDNEIRENRVGDTGKSDQIGVGGAFALFTINAEPVISRNLVHGNRSSDFGGAAFMAELYNPPKAYPTYGLFENNVFEFNYARLDGGVGHARTTEARFRSNTLAENDAIVSGGAFYIGKSENNQDQLALINNLIVFNTVDTYNTGGGLYLAPQANPTVSHNDLFGNMPDNVGGAKGDGDYIGSSGNVSDDPAFQNGGLRYRNLRLAPLSLVLDVGDNAEAPGQDKDNRPRVVDGDGDTFSDIDPGAFEFDPAAGPDFDGDGVSDAADPDDDNDGVADGQDCDPFDASLFRLPGPIGPTLAVQRTGSDAELTWSRGVQGFVSNVYRGSLLAPFAYNEACFLAEATATTATDPDVPAVGTGFYYLVSAKNGCGESRTGEDRIGGTPGDYFTPTPCAAQSLDSDGDGWLDVQDNCAIVANPVQEDADLDFAGDPCDCAPTDPTNPPPPEVSGLTVSQAGSTQVAWGAVAGGGVRYDVASGALSALLGAGTAGATCVSDDQPTTSFDDTRPNPAAGDGFYYLSRAESDCGSGPWGFESAGAERTPAAACP
jgi:hypothetical protein